DRAAIGGGEFLRVAQSLVVDRGGQGRPAVVAGRNLVFAPAGLRAGLGGIFPRPGQPGQGRGANQTPRGGWGRGAHVAGCAGGRRVSGGGWGWARPRHPGGERRRAWPGPGLAGACPTRRSRPRVTGPADSDLPGGPIRLSTGSAATGGTSSGSRDPRDSWL